MVSREYNPVPELRCRPFAEAAKTDMPESVDDASNEDMEEDEAPPPIAACPESTSS